MSDGRRILTIPHIAGAASWGVFFSIAPIVEAVEFGAVIWVPLLLFCEWRRARRFRFFPGAAIRFAVVAGIVTAAFYAPFKFLDRPVGPFRNSPVRVDDLESALRAHDIYIRARPKDHGTEVALPDRVVTLRQLFTSIEQQTGMRYRVGYCGNGMSVLYGAHPIFITFEPTDGAPARFDAMDRRLASARGLGYFTRMAGGRVNCHRHRG